MIVQIFRIHIINEIVSKPRVDTTMKRNSILFDACRHLYRYMYIRIHKSNVQFVLHKSNVQFVLHV